MRQSRVLNRNRTKKTTKRRILKGKSQRVEKSKKAHDPSPSSQNSENETSIVELNEGDYEIEETGASLGETISLNLDQELTPVGRLMKEQMERMGTSINHMYTIIEPLAKNPNHFTKELIVAHKTASEMIKNFVTLTKLLKEEFKDEDKDNKVIKGTMLDIYNFMMNYDCECCKVAIMNKFGEFLLDVERNEHKKGNE